MGIQFAPLRIPVKRRLQTAAVALISALPLWSSIATILILFTPLFWLMIPYFVWIYFDDSPFTGKRQSPWWRRTALWQYTADYFPCKLVREVPIPGDRNYIFGVHPHGAIPVASYCNFMSEATGYSELFPGITMHLSSVSQNFWVPFSREVILSSGMVDAGKRACKNILAQPGHSLLLPIGGALESLNCHPGTYDLVLNKRKGFAKLALETGSSLVPVFSFGETDIWKQLPNPKGSLLRRIQEAMPYWIGITVPVIHGRGYFQYSFGIQPYRKPLTCVVGKPIEVVKSANPTAEEINALHARYVKELIELFDRHKDEFAPHRKSDIRIIE